MTRFSLRSALTALALTASALGVSALVSGEASARGFKGGWHGHHRNHFHGGFRHGGFGFVNSGFHGYDDFGRCVVKKVFFKGRFIFKTVCF